MIYSPDTKSIVEHPAGKKEVQVNEILHFLFPLFHAYYVKNFLNSIELFHLVNKESYSVGDCLHS